MKNFLKRALMGLSLALIPALLFASADIARAQPAPADTPDTDASEQQSDQRQRHTHGHREWQSDADNDLFSMGHDSHLLAGQSAGSVVSILGSAINDGQAHDVLAVVGNTRVTGTVQEDAVAVFGNTYIDGKTGGDAMAVLGDLELGPNADVGGDVVAVGGTLKRDPGAIVHGDVQSVFPGHVSGLEWLRPWIRHCLLLGRPLALAPGLGWAWGLALGLLALYVLLALLFGAGVTQCVQTFEAKPGSSMVAALLTVLLAPVVVTLLCVTVIGIAAVPFVVVGLLCISLFGKTVMLSWLGRRCLGKIQPGALSHPAVTVLIGGAVALLLYLLPILGFVIYKLLGLLGLGAVVYTILQAVRARRVARGVEPPPAQAAVSAAAIAAAADAAPSPSPSPSPVPSPPPPQAEPATPSEPPQPEAQTLKAAAAPSATASLPRAGFWIRIAALILDVLLVGILLGVAHHIFRLELLALAAYGAVMWKLRGSTIGGIVFDLQVVRLDGRDIDWSTAIVRALGCFLSLAAVGLGFIWIAFDRSNQAWHDKIAGTVVVRVAKGVSLV